MRRPSGPLVRLGTPAHNVAAFRARARRRLPRAIFDFIDGGAEEEVTLRANRSAFDAVALLPRVLVDVEHRHLATTVCGIPLAAPLLIAPTGLAGVVHPDGERAGALAAEQRGLPFVLSTASSYAIEEVASASTAAPWFQLYPSASSAGRDDLVDRAERAGCPALVVTVDCATTGNRERDVVNGMTIPPRLTPSSAIDGVLHPRWLAGLLTGRRVTMGNIDPTPSLRAASTLAASGMKVLSARFTWDDLERIRDRWARPLVVKGVLTPDDARRAVDRGADGVVVSNHGGRQLDGTPASLDVLPGIVDAVAASADVLLDGGVRRGTDIAKALALGAKACLVGRPWLYGLACGGQAGVGQVLDVLVAELDRTLALLGRSSVHDLDRSCLADPGRRA